MRTVEEHPTRVFTNALVNHGWRNGPVEDVHAGEWTTLEGNTFTGLSAPVATDAFKNKTSKPQFKNVSTVVRRHAVRPTAAAKCAPAPRKFASSACVA